MCKLNYLSKYNYYINLKIVLENNLRSILKYFFKVLVNNLVSRVI